MEYGKEAVIKVLDRLVELGRLDPRQRTTLLGFDMIDSPKVFAQIIPVGREERKQYELMVMCGVSHKCISCPILSDKWWANNATALKLDPIDGQINLMGIAFRLVSLDSAPVATPMRRCIFIIEDIEAGDVHLTEAGKMSEGLQLIRAGRIGNVFKRRFGDNFKDRIRVYVCTSLKHVDKYMMEIYLLGILADRARAAARMRVLSRFYKLMSTEDRREWNLKYPHTGQYLLTDYDTNYIRREMVQ